MSGTSKATNDYAKTNRTPIDPKELRRLRTMMLHAINQDADLTAHTRVVGVFLCGHINVQDAVRRGEAWPSANYIAEHLGIAKRTVYRAIQELEGRYFRVRRTRGRANTNIYLPIWPPDHIDPARLGEIRQRVIAAEAEDEQAAEADQTDSGECISVTDTSKADTDEAVKGDNANAKKVSQTAPNIRERNKNTRARDPEPVKPSSTVDRLGEGKAGASPPAIDSKSFRAAFKQRFGETLYRARFAAARIDGTTIIFPNYIWATSIDRFHLFLREQGVTEIRAADRNDWSVSLTSRI